ncbi:MAG: UDP-2,3-diacylglucosamine diphosphatase [Bacteroidota bacterium]|jgi:UDP-2,3-diacylglucosamine hydrolase
MENISLEQGKSIYFVSDFHLGFPSYIQSQEKEKKIVSWLSSIQDHTSHLFILGDAFDFWFEYDKVVPKGFIRFLGKLAELADKGIHIHFFVGNHDLWLKDYLSSEMKIKIYHKPENFTIQMDGKNHIIQVGHGDGLGFDNRSFKILRAIYLNKIAQRFFKLLHPDLGIKLAHYWSNTRKYSLMKANSAWEKFDPEHDYIIKYIRHSIQTNPSIQTYIFGHRHALIDYDCGQGIKYFNLGDWIMENRQNAAFIKLNHESLQFLLFRNIDL